MQGTIIALLISLIVGFVIGYFINQRRISSLDQALQEQKEREAALEEQHEQRLREATKQLQQDYQAQLAEKIERYQDQLEERVALIEQEYDGRLAVIEQGRMAAGHSSAEPVMAALSPQSPDMQQVEQQLKHQYEHRLKEAAQKIQLAYEQHLRLKLQESKDSLQSEYEQRLAQKIEHYEQELEARDEQIKSEYEARLRSLTTPGTVGAVAAGVASVATAGAIADVAVPDTAIADIRREIETDLRQEYEQRLAEKIEHYQDDLTQRIETLEAEYEARLQAMRSTHAAAGAVDTGARDTDETAELTTEAGDLAAMASLGEIESQMQAEYDQRLAAQADQGQEEAMLPGPEPDSDLDNLIPSVEAPAITDTVIAPEFEAPQAEAMGEEMFGEAETYVFESPEADVPEPAPVLDETAELNFGGDQDALTPDELDALARGDLASDLLPPEVERLELENGPSGTSEQSELDFSDDMVGEMDTGTPADFSFEDALDSQLDAPEASFSLEESLDSSAELDSSDTEGQSGDLNLEDEETFSFDMPSTSDEEAFNLDMPSSDEETFSFDMPSTSDETDDLGDLGGHEAVNEAAFTFDDLPGNDSETADNFGEDDLGGDLDNDLAQALIDSPEVDETPSEDTEDGDNFSFDDMLATELDQTPPAPSESPSADELFSLDDVLAMAHAPQLENDLDLTDDSSDEGGLDLDELLFDDPNPASESKSDEDSDDDFNFDDLSNLS